MEFRSEESESGISKHCRSGGSSPFRFLGSFCHIPCFYVLLSIFCFPLSASAHAYPAIAVPADGAVVRQAPREARIQFTEGIEIEFSAIVVKNGAGEIVSRGNLRRIADDTLAIDLKPLLAGSYTVEWQVLSVDTHVTEGRFQFAVDGGGK